MDVTQNTQADLHGSKRALKKQNDRELRFYIASLWDAFAQEHARVLAADPPALSRTNPVPESLGWFFPIGDVGARIFTQIICAAQPKVDQLIEEYRLIRGDADMWRRWFAKRLSFWAAQYARSAPMEVAKHMAGIFAYRYNIPFEYHYSHGAAVFFVPDGRSLGDGWETLRDTVVQGGCPEDPDCLRVVWAYHQDRQLLACLHYTRVYMPCGRQVYKWVLWQEWVNMWRNAAETVVSRHDR